MFASVQRKIGTRSVRQGITVSYSGVHQAYQLALAAHELGYLSKFYCSVFNTPGKWGGALGNVLGEKLLSRAINGLPPEVIYEFPWPLMLHSARSNLMPQTAHDWTQANSWFDGFVAKRLPKDENAIFVGGETCAAKSLEAARKLGLQSILDCPGISATYVDSLAARSAEEFGLRASPSADSRLMQKRKQRELELADIILVCSEVQARLLLATEGVPESKLRIIPLWSDTSFWKWRGSSTSSSKPLRVLFAGKIGLRKGVPYLMKAVEAITGAASLTLVGSVDEDLQPLLELHRARLTVLRPLNKKELRECYYAHDVLVLPSLGDSFGFVVFEAMACGLPVIVTENCGVPVPDPGWRVPIMNADAITERLLLYATDRELCKEHGRLAMEFAKQYTPERYRDQVKAVYRGCLGQTN